MKKRQTSLTSIIAHDSIKPLKAAIQAKIIKALEELRIGATFYEISSKSGLQAAQVWRRLSELETMGLIFNTDITRPGLSGRSCTVWQLSRFLPVSKDKVVNIQFDLFSQ